MNLPISAGAAVDPDRSESLSLTMLVTRRVEESVLPQVAEMKEEKQVVEVSQPEEAKGKKRKKVIASQTELEFEKTPTRFARSSPSVRGSEDLDRPTFQRKGIKLKV